MKLSKNYGGRYAATQQVNYYHERVEKYRNSNCVSVYGTTSVSVQKEVF